MSNGFPCAGIPPPLPIGPSTTVPNSGTPPSPPWTAIGAQVAALSTQCYPTYIAWAHWANRPVAFLDVAGIGNPPASFLAPGSPLSSQALYTHGWTFLYASAPPALPGSPILPPSGAGGGPPPPPGVGAGGTGASGYPGSGPAPPLPPLLPPSAPPPPPAPTPAVPPSAPGGGVIQTAGGTQIGAPRQTPGGQCCWLTPPPGSGQIARLASAGVCQQVQSGSLSLPGGWTAQTGSCTAAPPQTGGALPPVPTSGTGARIQSPPPVAGGYANLTAGGAAGGTTYYTPSGAVAPTYSPPSQSAAAMPGTPPINVSVNGQPLCCTPCSS